MKRIIPVGLYLLTLACAFIGGNGSACAFIINPGEQYWLSTASGNRSANGDPVTLTWSIVPDGTTIIDNNDFGNLGGSDLIGSFDAEFGGDPNGNPNNDLQARPWFQYFQQAFQRWENLSGANYIYEPNDDGSIAGSSSPDGVLGVRGDLRIAGAGIDGNSNTLAFNYFPDHGDMVLDTDDTDGLLGNSANNYRGLRNVIMHEHGHGIGLNHVNSSSDQLLLEPFIDTSFDGPQLDDVRAIQYYFGDANEKSNGGLGNGTAANATPLGTIAGGSSASVGSDADVPTQAIGANDIDFVSLANLADTDFYSFDVTEASTVTATLTPRGGVFTQGSVGATPTSFNASARSDLVLTIFDTNGATPLATANLTGQGGMETVADLELDTAGQYYARVTGLDDTIQLYELELAVSALTFVEADFDTDGDVDHVDLGIWEAAYGSTLQGDANGDSITNGLDFIIWQQQYTGSQVSVSAVPEPPATVMLVLGLLGMAVRRCKR